MSISLSRYDNASFKRLQALYEEKENKEREASGITPALPSLSSSTGSVKRRFEKISQSSGRRWKGIKNLVSSRKKINFGNITSSNFKPSLPSLKTRCKLFSGTKEERERRLVKTVALVTAVFFGTVTVALTLAAVAGVVIFPPNAIVGALLYSVSIPVTGSIARKMISQDSDGEDSEGGSIISNIYDKGIRKGLSESWKNMRIDNWKDYRKAWVLGGIEGFGEAQGVADNIEMGKKAVKGGPKVAAKMAAKQAQKHVVANVTSLYTTGKTEKVSANSSEIHDFKLQDSRFQDSDEKLISSSIFEEKNLKEIQNVLRAIHSDKTLPFDHQQLMAGEVISKRLAFINFKLIAKKKLYIELPVSVEGKEEPQMQRFKIENIFTSKAKIPCWGLVPVEKASDDQVEGVAPIVLWRGTSPSLTAEGGLASVAQNMDPGGPAYTMFDTNREKLEDWLSAKTENGSFARVIGYSQGAALATYTAAEFPEYLDQDYETNPSYACSAPGVNKKHLNLWNQIKEEERPALVSTYTAKDPVSMPVTGECLVSGRAYLLESYAKELQGKGRVNAKAHTCMITTRKEGFGMTKVDLKKENSRISRGLFRAIAPIRNVACLGQGAIDRMGAAHGRVLDKQQDFTESGLGKLAVKHVGKTKKMRRRVKVKKMKSPGN
ncbi:hypothetical protein AB751O23_BD_00090 [Chlamydiales bacterium SCGC AB-751-O23]|nr:hypothetical protein AB751O23_BD_00090 [Chlamydiales bacterium SCGC AB-751-O23]